MARIRWLNGAVWVGQDGSGVLLDCPPGISHSLGSDLQAVQAIVLSSGRMRSVGGLLELLDALGPHRGSHPLPIKIPLGDERAPALVEAWERGWPDRFPIEVDHQRPGAHIDLGKWHAQTHELRCAEPNWSRGTLVPHVGVAIRVDTGSSRIAWIPNADPRRSLRRPLDGVDHAVIEVGQVPWPVSDGADRWRRTLREAVEASAGVAEVWLVGDDGSFPLGDS